MTPLPDLVPQKAVPLLLNHLLSALDQPRLDGPPERAFTEKSAGALGLEFAVTAWARPPFEVRISTPVAPNLEFSAEIRDERARLRLVGPIEGLLQVGFEGKALWLAEAEAALKAYWNLPVLMRSLPSLPKKWRSLAARHEGSLSRVRYAFVAPGVTVLLSGVSRERPVVVAFSVLGAGSPLPVSLLGPVKVRLPSRSSRRWLLELAAGAPLPSLQALIPRPTYPDPVPVTGQPADVDRHFTPQETSGLLAARTGAAGREILRIGLCATEIVRESRIAIGTREDVAALEIEGAARWTVEWAMQDNQGYVPGDPGGRSNLFARSLPPEGREPRRFEVFAHDVWAEEAWMRSFESHGLRCIEAGSLPEALGPTMP